VNLGGMTSGLAWNGLAIMHPRCNTRRRAATPGSVRIVNTTSSFSCASGVDAKRQRTAGLHCRVSQDRSGRWWGWLVRRNPPPMKPPPTVTAPGPCRICDGGVAASAPSSKPVPIGRSGASHTTARSIHWVQCAPDLDGSTIDVTRARLLVIGARARRPAGGVPHERRARAPHICQESRMVPADTGRHFYRPPGTTKPRPSSGLSFRFERRADRHVASGVALAGRAIPSYAAGEAPEHRPARADALFAAPGFSRRVARAQR